MGLAVAWTSPVNVYRDTVSHIIDHED